MKNKEFYKKELEKLLIEGQTHVICDFKRFHEPLCRKACEFKDCAICKEGFRFWLEDEHKEPYKLTLFAKSILEHAAKYGFKYITWYTGSGCWVHVNKPTFSHTMDKWTGDYCEDISLFVDCFPFITGLETEPYSIKDILDNCEVIEDD